MFELAATVSQAASHHPQFCLRFREVYLGSEKKNMNHIRDSKWWFKLQTTFVFFTPTWKDNPDVLGHLEVS